MKRREFALGAVAAALPGLLSLPVQAQSSQGYIELKKPARVDAPEGKIEVIEFFSYGCVHCKNFEPIFDAWQKATPDDVSVRHVHVAFSSAFEPLQRIYYALDAIGAVDQAHGKVFAALQDERKRLDQPDVLFPWIAEQGVDRTKFEAAYKSFGVATQMRRGAQVEGEYMVEGTPALGIAGRYYTDGSMAGGLERMIQVANRLIEQERQRS